MSVAKLIFHRSCKPGTLLSVAPVSCRQSKLRQGLGLTHQQFEPVRLTAQEPREGQGPAFSLLLTGTKYPCRCQRWALCYLTSQSPQQAENSIATLGFGKHS